MSIIRATIGFANRYAKFPNEYVQINARNAQNIYNHFDSSWPASPLYINFNAKVDREKYNPKKNVIVIKGPIIGSGNPQYLAIVT
jgi:hypothetical protein